MQARRSRWLQPVWRASVWDWHKRVFMWFRIICWNSGEAISYACILEQIFWWQQRKILNLQTENGSVPESQPGIMMRSLLDTASLRKSRFPGKGRSHCWKIRSQILPILLKQQKRKRDSSIRSSRWKKQRKPWKQNWKNWMTRHVRMMWWLLSN